MKKISIPKRIYLSYLDNNSDVIITNDDLWQWRNFGSLITFNWKQLNNIPYTLIQILKGYLCYRFNKISISSINSDIRMIKKLNDWNSNFPFKQDLPILLLKSNNSLLVYSFRSFYKWGINYNFDGFNHDLYQKIIEIKTENRKPYEKIFLNPIYFSTEEINKIYLKTKNYIYNNVDENSLKSNIILHISYELAPRPSQLYKLNVNDFIVVKSDKKSYYSLNLPMSKKIKSKSLEKRHRNISSRLGNKIQFYLDNYMGDLKTDKPLFSSNDMRISSQKISVIISNELKKLNIYNKSSTDLRHHLAQSLADQGSPAEIIAEILGHNSTLPARAYIAATPKIAEIKANALGKSEKYKNIISMLTTGDIIEKDLTNPERWVQGAIGNQYIGGIGSCGLPEDTSCPKNPVYACYTCIKFHPFKEGDHKLVKHNLENQAQLFIDIAEIGNDIEHNRPVTQLNTVISAVNNVINIIEKDYE